MQNGRSVDYASMKTSALFAEFQALAARLRLVDLGTLSAADRKAFFLSSLLRSAGVVFVAVVDLGVQGVLLFFFPFLHHL